MEKRIFKNISASSEPILLIFGLDTLEILVFLDFGFENFKIGLKMTFLEKILKISVIFKLFQFWTQNLDFLAVLTSKSEKLGFFSI